MPELPEVERVRRTLIATVVGKTVSSLHIRRRDVVHGSAKPKALLAGKRIERIDRHGKQLCLISAGDQACVCVHLGMTGSLRFFRQRKKRIVSDNHCHVTWRFECGGQLVFRDPRRFGGLWTFTRQEDLWLQRWNTLGPDATTITTKELYEKLTRTNRAIKSALLDQHVVAGLGNIYVDELLFACRVCPLEPAAALTKACAQRMVRGMRRILERAVTAGGSTLRDYVDGNGRQGSFQSLHQVYGRGGKPCKKCRRLLSICRIAGRTTVFCLYCQGTNVLTIKS